MSKPVVPVLGSWLQSGRRLGGVSRAFRPRRLATATLLAVGLAALFTQADGHAQGADALGYSRGFLVTGNYVVGGVDLPRDGGTGTINFNGALGNTVPPDAELVAAFLYWEALAPPDTAMAGAMFRGAPIVTAKASRLTSLPGTGSANCWGASGNLDRVLTMYRADVLHMLPKQYDAADRWTGRYLVNDADLTSHGLPLHQVSLGQTGSGNTLTAAAGATLLFVYRDLAEPLRKIVLYDGVHAQAQGTTTTQTIRGIYRSSATPSARITHIVGSGAGNARERLLFNGSVIATDPFPTPIDGGSDRGWANPTFDVSSLMPGTDGSDGFGEIVTTSVDHGANNENATPYECLTWAAIIFSTAVADTDHDGLPDGIEDTPGGLRDPPTAAFPQGEPLPNLHGMGARVGQRDLIVEFNAMYAQPGTTYGSASAPYNATHDSVTDHAGHNHMPTPAVLRRVGEAYLAGGITAHFDVGDLAAYRQLGPEYACLDDAGSECDANAYLVPSQFARGGGLIEERACATCQFSAFPGTVGWPFGFQLYRNAPVGDGGEELTTAQVLEGWTDGTRRRRFDRVRQDYVHYALVAHARGKARSSLPCLAADGETPTDYDVITDGARLCVTPNPQFHVPSSASGVADLPGGNVLVTLGLWDTEHFVGSPYVQASTILHELGHNVNLWHGGQPAIWGNKAQGTTTYVEPNCKPNYLSSMSYLFQVHGLFDDSGKIHLDYSRTAHYPLNETSLTDSTLFPEAGFRPVWFTPAESPLASTLGASAAKRYCNGVAFDSGAPPSPALARVQAANTSSVIDWDGDSATFGGAADVNFDGVLNEVLHGHDDWANVRLDQIRAGRTVRIFTSASGDLLDFGSGDLLDFGSGDLLDFGSGDLLDFGSGTHLVHLASGDFLRYGSGDLLDFGSGDLLDFGSGVLMYGGTDVGAAGDLLDFGSGDLLDFGSGDLLDFGSGDLLDFGSGDLLDFGSGDLLDFGSGDLLDFGSGSGLQELDFDTALALEAPRPHGLVACVLGVNCPDPQPQPFDATYHRIELSWNPPTFGTVSAYQVYRATGGMDPVLVGTTSATTFIDTEELPNGVEFTYWLTATFADGSSSANSDAVVIMAVNDPPVAEDDGYVTPQGTALSVSADGVLANDTDVDSPASSLRLFAVTSGPSNGSLSAHEDGSFTYTPHAGFSGTDSFTYVADNGTWSRDASVPLSGASNDATVTIDVVAPARYGFINVENLPPADRKTFKGGSTAPLRWQWTDPSGQPFDSSGAGAIVKAYACSTRGSLPPAFPVGSFTPQQPGSGNTFSFDLATLTWRFNWKLQYTVTNPVTGQAATYVLPAGTYVVQVSSSVTGQTDPALSHECADGTTVRGALLTVK